MCVCVCVCVSVCDIHYWPRGLRVYPKPFYQPYSPAPHVKGSHENSRLTTPGEQGHNPQMVHQQDKGRGNGNKLNGDETRDTPRTLTWLTLWVPVSERHMPSTFDIRDPGSMCGCCNELVDPAVHSTKSRTCEDGLRSKHVEARQLTLL